jgi:hypothetical protein
MRKILTFVLVSLFLSLCSFFLGRVTTEYLPTLASRESSLYENLVWFCFSQNTPDFYFESTEKYFNSADVQALLEDTKNAELLRVAAEAREIIENKMPGKQ